MRTIFGREPAAILGCLQAVLALAVSFGVDLTAQQQGLILAAAAALVAVIVRAKVSPVRAVGAVKLSK